MPDAAGSAPGAALCWGTVLLTHELASWRGGVETREGMAEKKGILLIYICQVNYIAVNNRIIACTDWNAGGLIYATFKSEKNMPKSDAEA